MPRHRDPEKSWGPSAVWIRKVPLSAASTVPIGGVVPPPGGAQLLAGTQTDPPPPWRGAQQPLMHWPPVVQFDAQTLPPETMMHVASAQHSVAVGHAAPGTIHNGAAPPAPPVAT